MLLRLLVYCCYGVIVVVYNILFYCWVGVGFFFIFDGVRYIVTWCGLKKIDMLNNVLAYLVIFYVVVVYTILFIAFLFLMVSGILLHGVFKKN